MNFIEDDLQIKKIEGETFLKIENVDFENLANV